MRPRSTIKAVWDSDLESLLKSVDLLDSLVGGDLKCAVCAEAVTLDNLAAVLADEEGVKVTCDETTCVHAVTQGEPTPLGRTS